MKPNEVRDIFEKYGEAVEMLEEETFHIPVVEGYLHEYPGYFKKIPDFYAQTLAGLSLRFSFDPYDNSLEVHLEDETNGIVDHDVLQPIAEKYGFSSVYVFYKDGTRSGTGHWRDPSGVMARTSWNRWNRHNPPVFDLATADIVDGVLIRGKKEELTSAVQ